jgi:hypothetical protein
MDRIKLNYLHKADRGAHVYWLEKGTVETRPDHILNLIHYEVTMSFFYTLLFYFRNYVKMIHLCRFLLLFF